jgi:hypothetical protein
MAVEAVIGEPVSAYGIPCSTGKYREFSAVPSGSSRLAADMPLFLLVKLSEFPKSANRELLRRNRELGLGNRDFTRLQQAMTCRTATRASERSQVWLIVGMTGHDDLCITPYRESASCRSMKSPNTYIRRRAA